MLFFVEVREVDGQVGRIHLKIIMDRLLAFGRFLLVGADEHNIVSTYVAVIINFARLVLQVLLVLKVVEKAVSCYTLNHLIEIEFFLRNRILCFLTFLHLAKLVIRQGSDTVLHEVFFVADVSCFVTLFERVIIAIKAFDEPIILIFFIF